MCACLLSSSLSTNRVKACIEALRNGCGVIVVDDEQRENEGDIVFAAEKITESQMALTIRHGSGIVCLCITEKLRKKLKLPMMVSCNTSRYKTAFTVSIEAAHGVTTGVSAADRVTTIRAAISSDAKPSNLNRPGHVFPICAKNNGVLERRGHTEATIDLMRLAALLPVGVLCEIMNDDGTMARMPEITIFARENGFPVVTVNDIVQYRMLIYDKY